MPPLVGAFLYWEANDRGLETQLRLQSAIIGFPIEKGTNKRRHGIANPANKKLCAVGYVGDAPATVPIEVELNDLARTDKDDEGMSKFMEKGVKPLKPDAHRYEDNA